MRRLLDKLNIAVFLMMTLSLSGIYLAYYVELNSRTIADIILVPIAIVSFFVLVDNLRKFKTQ